MNNIRPSLLPIAAGAVFAAAMLASAAAGAASMGAPAAGSGAELVPIGAGYETNTLAYFSLRAFEHDSDDVVTIRVLPITYATDPYNITPGERAANLALAQDRAAQIEDACDAAVGPPAVCDAAVIDIQVRNDAENAALVNQLTPATDGIFILGGDQTIAMLVAANTLLEDTLQLRFEDGTPLGGTSAGAAVQSRYMIAGYTGNNFAWHALKFGAIELWYGPPGDDERGLLFGLDTAVIEQHVLERGRIARLLQATERLPASHLGVGVDWGTGVRIESGALVTGTVGAYTAVIVDQETYGAAAGAEYFGPDQVLSIHGVALHLLPPGGYGYDLADRVPAFDGTALPAPDISGRDYGLQAAPPGAGQLYLGGDLSNDPLGPVSSEFAEAAKAAGGTSLVFAAGYTSDNAAIQAMNTWIGWLEQLGVPDVAGVALTSGADPVQIAAELAGAEAIFMVGGRGDALANQVPAMLAAGIDDVLVERWHAGAPILLDNAAAAASGDWMSAEPPPADVEIEASDSFLAGHIDIAPGLGLLPGVVFEPRFLYDYLYGRLVSHLAAHPDTVGFGIERATAIRIDPEGVFVLGDMAVMALDGRYLAFIGSGSNDAFAAAWILLDTFAVWEEIPTGVPELEESIYLPIVIR